MARIGRPKRIKRVAPAPSPAPDRWKEPAPSRKEPQRPRRSTPQREPSR